MLLTDLNRRNEILTSEQVLNLRIACSEFLEESCGVPTLINISSKHPFVKTKVRHKNNTMFTHMKYVEGWTYRSDRTTIVTNTRFGNYWFFPPNGYRYAYNSNISNYHHHTPNLIDQVQDMDFAAEILSESYKSTELLEALTKSNEILWHTIPFYYAVDCSLFRDYGELLNIL